MCACANKGENFERSDRTRGRLVWFLKNLLSTGLCECIILGELHLWEGKTLFGEFLLWFGSWFPRFPSASCMTASSVTSVFEESCFGFWSIASSRCPCLRELICAWVSDYSWLSELFVTCLSSSLSCFYFITSLVSGGVLTMHSSRGRLRNVEYSILLVMSELSTVRCDRVLGLWLQGHGRRLSMESCRGGAQSGRQLWQNRLNYPGSSAQAITIKATLAQTHFKRNNSGSVG